MLEETEVCRIEAERLVGSLAARDRDMFALGLYAGEGSKTANRVSMANTNPLYLSVFVAWLREQFLVDEARLHARLYLHADLNLDVATQYWSRILSIPSAQFHKPYRAVADATRRSARHEYGCATVVYCCATTYRRVLARIEAVTSRFDLPG
jgi:hypothetical protein